MPQHLLAAIHFDGDRAAAGRSLDHGLLHLFLQRLVLLLGLRHQFLQIESRHREICNLLICNLVISNPNAARSLGFKLQNYQITKLQIDFILSPDNRSRCGFRLRIFPACVARSGPVRRGCVRFRSMRFRSMERRGAGAACGAPPGSTCILIGLPARPLAAALAMRRASAVNDISIIVLEAATFAVSAFPSSLHSAFSNMETSIC